MTAHRHDLSISMERANIIFLFISIPVVILQFGIFTFLHGAAALEPSLGWPLLLLTVLLGIVIHELIHGFAWAIFGRKRLSAVKFGVLWKTLTPYAHLKEPVNDDLALYLTKESNWIYGFEKHFF